MLRMFRICSDTFQNDYGMFILIAKLIEEIVHSLQSQEILNRPLFVLKIQKNSGQICMDDISERGWQFTRLYYVKSIEI
jgi:hypothetical protein